MDEHRFKLAEAEQKADAAAQLLKNPTLIDAFERLEAAYTSAWRNSDPHKADDREVIFYRLQALDALKKDLEAVMSGGKLMAFNLKSRLR